MTSSSSNSSSLHPQDVLLASRLFDASNKGRREGRFPAVISRLTGGKATTTSVDSHEVSLAFILRPTGGKAK